MSLQGYYGSGDYGQYGQGDSQGQMNAAMDAQLRMCRQAAMQNVSPLYQARSYASHSAVSSPKGECITAVYSERPEADRYEAKRSWLGWLLTLLMVAGLAWLVVAAHAHYSAPVAVETP
mgnify:CR=1 FL=1